ncbi:DNA cytosine methyltransferase [Sphingobacterium yanglingense]|uniref:DNA (cytosine-5-)-methyltransferase n=1 Tax=Sphingobacterium yanglingense TaxID=1437280 RepID=A0A4R6WKS7_9SPHI|nr:DNA cytosine methyltransferase [Sphingobacterium yanglingense]TDQ79547.1 C-5 cytosine-specific DNA methylase [Sphingobacterium yanglingense]
MVLYKSKIRGKIRPMIPPKSFLKPDEVKFLLQDFFCGFGGVGYGARSAKNTIVVGAVNHDSEALDSHALNLPDTVHFNEDITVLYGEVKHGILFKSPQMQRLIRLFDLYRAFYPNAKVVVHFSHECTNYSLAKGGQPRDPDSRSLPEHSDRYIHALDPDIITIENVKEFMSWGPMKIKCVKEHKEDLTKGIYANTELKWIFNKKKNRDELAYVPISTRKGEDYLRWVENIKSLGYKYDYRLLNAADFGAYTSRNRLFINFSKPNIPVSWPKATHSKNGCSQPDLFGEGLKKWNAVKDLIDFSDEGDSIFTKEKRLSDNTLDTIIAGIKKFVPTQENNFMYKYYGNGHNLNSIDDPAGTIPTKDRFGKICCILRNYRTGFTTSIDTAIGTLPTVPKANLLSFIRNPSHFGHTTSINTSCPTLIARQDKAPLSVVNAIEGKINPAIVEFLNEKDWAYINQESGSKKTKALELIECMFEYGISDIMMRMLRVDELLVIQGFPEDYIMVGPETRQKKFIGNSVVPLAYKVILEALEEVIFTTDNDDHNNIKLAA